MHKTLLFLVLFSYICLAFGATRAKQVATIRPGQGEMRADLNDEKKQYCLFKYDAVGATPEEWIMRLRIKDGKLTCLVGREDAPTYLKFIGFQAELGSSAGTYHLDSTEVWDNTGAVLPGDEYLIGQNSVTHKDGWSGTLAKLKIEHVEKSDEPTLALGD